MKGTCFMCLEEILPEQTSVLETTTGRVFHHKPCYHKFMGVDYESKTCSKASHAPRSPVRSTDLDCPVDYVVDLDTSSD